MGCLHTKHERRSRRYSLQSPLVQQRNVESAELSSSHQYAAAPVLLSRPSQPANPDLCFTPQEHRLLAQLHKRLTPVVNSGDIGMHCAEPSRLTPTPNLYFTPQEHRLLRRIYQQVNPGSTAGDSIDCQNAAMKSVETQTSHVDLAGHTVNMVESSTVMFLHLIILSERLPYVNFLTLSNL